MLLCLETTMVEPGYHFLKDGFHDPSYNKHIFKIALPLPGSVVFYGIGVMELYILEGHCHGQPSLESKY